VNPLIAVLLGWLLLGEHVGTRTFAAMVLILGAVLWIQVSHAAAVRQEAEAQASD
jgi:drug/metabolite transporter (DMT)-like permease